MAKRLASTLFVLWLLFLPSTALARSASETGKLTLQPDHLSIGLFFGGEDILLQARIPAGYDAVVRVTGPDEPLEFKRKGKRLGLIWMNDGEVSYKDVPSLFLIQSSRRLSELAAEATLKDMRIGYGALRARAIADSGDIAGAFFGDLIKLKENDGLFCTREGAVSILPQADGSEEISCRFLLPARTPVGEYAVELFGFSGGRGLLLASGKLTLDRSPMVSFITSMAAGHGLIYGCLAVGIAIIAGLLTGFIFGLGKGGAH